MQMDDNVIPLRHEEPGSFPVHLFRRLWALNGYLPIDTTIDPMPTAHGMPIQVRWQMMERAELAHVYATVWNAFVVHRARHGLRRGHWYVWCGTEVGTKKVLARKGVWQYVYHRPEIAGSVMREDEVAAHYDFTERTVHEYHRAANKAIQDEWTALHFYQG